MSSLDIHITTPQDVTYSRIPQKTLRCICCSAVIQRHAGAVAKKATPGVRRFWFLPPIEPPYPVAKAREPMPDPSTYVSALRSGTNFTLTIYSIPCAKLVSRLTVQFSGLSLSDRMSTSSAAWSCLERLPPEIIGSIATHLAFWDRKALAGTSQRVYHLLGPDKPPDRFSWRIHLCTSFNRAPSEYFDLTILSPDDLARELMRVLRQTPEALKRGHYVFDPMKSRLKDLSCLYFPVGFQIGYRTKQIRCRTLGQFIALQIDEYINRVLKETRQAESAIGWRHRASDIETIEGHQQQPKASARIWSDTHDRWFLGTCASISTTEQRSVQVGGRADTNLPTERPSSLCTQRVFLVDASIKLIFKMGYDFMCRRILSDGKICVVREDEWMENCIERAASWCKKRNPDSEAVPEAETCSGDVREERRRLSSEDESEEGESNNGRDESEVIEAQEQDHFGDAMYYYDEETGTITNAVEA